MNAYSWYGVGIDEFGEALEEALRGGGAGDDEVAEARLGVEVDAALPEDGYPWGVERLL